VFAYVGLFLVNDLAPIDAVLQHQVERAAGEWLATRDAARGARPQFALDAAGGTVNLAARRLRKRTEVGSRVP
jgi:hypothetical protein